MVICQVNKHFALYHLEKAASMNEKRAQFYLEEIYRKGIGIEKNEQKADSIFNILVKNETYKEVYKSQGRDVR